MRLDLVTAEGSPESVHIALITKLSSAPLPARMCPGITDAPVNTSERPRLTTQKYLCWISMIRGGPIGARLVDDYANPGNFGRLLSPPPAASQTLSGSFRGFFVHQWNQPSCDLMGLFSKPGLIARRIPALWPAAALRLAAECLLPCAKPYTY